MDIFQAGDIVDVTGTSKGKGFQGAIKAYNQLVDQWDMALIITVHQVQWVWHQMLLKYSKEKLYQVIVGDQVTIQNLEIVKVDTDRNVILIKGNVPGAKKSLIKY